jgi:hypothetical protein
MSPRSVPLLCACTTLGFALAPSGALSAPLDPYSDLSYMDPSLMSDSFFSASARLTSRARASFRNLGTVASRHELDDATSEIARTYDDGYVGVDSRTDGSGVDLPDDYRTNNWSYDRTRQVTADGNAIAFHAYSSTTNGAGQDAESGALNGGVEIEYGRTLGKFGRRRVELGRPFAWGFTAGLGLSDLNVKTRGTIQATLHVLTDYYSLLGAPAPVDDDPDDGTAYTGPSSKTVTVTNPDGSTTTYTIDTTTYLGNRPESRVEESFEDAAHVEGFWQVKGASLSLRVGPWFRWQPKQKLALRLSAGGAVSLIGLNMRYSETLVVDEYISITELDETADTKTFGIGGVFGAFDAEWWVTKRTGFFGSAHYEKYTDKVDMEINGRTADVQFSNGLGLRFGITTRF